MSKTKRQDRQERNYLINSAKDFAQRSTAAENLSAAYDFLTLDRHAYKTAGSFNGTPTIQRVTDSPDGKTKYCSEFSADFAAAGSELTEAQPIESINSRELVGELVSLSVWVKSTSCTTLKLDLSTADVEDDFTAVTGVHSSSKTITADGNWELVEFEAISLGSGVERGLLVAITFTDSDSTGATESHRIARGKLHIGKVAQDWSYAGRDYEDELAKCQRYYEKSYDIDVDPGTAGNPDGYFATVGNDGTAHNRRTSSELKNKRATPTITAYDLVGNVGRISFFTNGNAQNDNSTDFNLVGTGQNRIAVRFVTNTAYSYTFHWTADAEMAI